ncbi:MAG: ComF family protein [Pseudomonadota bacterium]
MNISSIFDQWFPPHCLLCQAPGGAVCAPCLADLPWLPDAHCPVCSLPTPGGGICGHCLKETPAFDRVEALFIYAFPIDRLIRQLKYREQLALAPLLGTLLTEKPQGGLPDVWLPMPLHANRLRQRGFNQAAEIARELSAKTGVPMRAGWAVRVRDTPPQAGLKREARRKNLRGAFSCNGKVAGLHVGVVDDVMTTGSTLDELAKTLKAAGAREVSCVVVARA